MQILKHNDLIEVPWKNGGGTTRNIARGLRAGQVAWTISRADVRQDGPFSDFHGMTRILSVVSGGEMTLQTPTGSLAANMWEPVCFDGALKIQSRLKGAELTDLNLMFDPQYCRGDVAVHQTPQKRQISFPSSGLLAFHVLAGSPVLDSVSLTTGDTAFFKQAGPDLELKPDDAILEIRLTFLDQSEAIKLRIADR